VPFFEQQESGNALFLATYDSEHYTLISNVSVCESCSIVPQSQNLHMSEVFHTPTYSNIACLALQKTDGNAVVIAVAQGAGVIWSAPIETASSTPIVDAKNRFVFVSTGHNIMTLDAATGAPLYSKSMDEKVGQLVLDNVGSVYALGSQLFNIYAFQVSHVVSRGKLSIVWQESVAAHINLPSDVSISFLGPPSTSPRLLSFLVRTNDGRTLAAAINVINRQFRASVLSEDYNLIAFTNTPLIGST
jgi:hypothetical protein